ncbi:MAG: O-antigen ligase family protein [Chloroflexota bacterium]
MIKQRHTQLTVALLLIFLLALMATAYFALQLRQPTSPHPADVLAAEKGYGVTIDLTSYDTATLSETLQDLQQSGFTWLRQPIAWAEVEPQPGQFEWRELDRIVLAVEETPQLKLIVVLQTSPEWARASNTAATTPPLETSDFGDFTRAVAQRYGQQIDHYQIWHEPNLSANWGDTFVDPAAYANLLRDAALNIRAVDSDAYILTAALAPTLEQGPLNLNEISYLDQLYQAKADDWFDIVAAQPYGFDSEPNDPATPDRLTFSRISLLRQVMLVHQDQETPIWATAFGWNALPTDWAGDPSPWKSDLPAVQAERTAAAITEARRHWPWLGPMMAIRWDTTDLTSNDPARGFSLTEIPAIREVLKNAANRQGLVIAGTYPANHPSGTYSPGWRFAGDSNATADIPREAPRTLAITFEGTRLDLTINRGPYRGYLWVTVDGQPANALPEDNEGRRYVVLYDPLRETEQVTLVQDLPFGQHEVMIEAEGGWGQWAISGWTVYNEPAIPSPLMFNLAAIVAIVVGLGLVWQFTQNPVPLTRTIWVWSDVAVTLYNRLGDRGHLAVTFSLAILFYLAPGIVALPLLGLLALSLLFRPDLGLALIVFSLSFFQAPKQLPVGTFSPVELGLLLTIAGFVFQGVLRIGRSFSSQNEFPGLPTFRPSSIDFAALLLLLLALLATFAAENFGVSMREWRVVIFGSVLFYFLVRSTYNFSVDKNSSDRWHWVWPLIDAFVAGAVLQAFIALYLYFFTDQSITAEGVRRALGLAYGSPNNLSLFLDRAWPILLAVGLLSNHYLRRWLYLAGLMIVSVALYLTFSKGALLIGLPVGVVAMAAIYSLRDQSQNWRRGAIAAVIGIALIGLALLPLSQTERFQTTFDLSQGSTGFFRIKLWQASWTMLQDNWQIGVGLDNFLYQYRTRYILPEAWQEPNLSHPHNLILDFGTRLGLGGIALLFWLQVAFWRNAWRLYHDSASPLLLGLMGSMAIFLSHGLVDNSYFLVDLAFIFFLTVGIVQRLSE